MSDPSNRTIRPQHPPSDWSPRPIPQAVEPRRTADPPTPSLKELAARVIPTPFASPARLTQPPAGPVAPRANTMTPAQCAAAWKEVLGRTQRVLDAGGGDDTPQQRLTRNRAISAAYAELAKGDPRMRWAGLASVVSTQAHCAMQDADTAVERTRDAAIFYHAVGAPVTVPLYEMSREVQGALYDTNREIFSDIYPAVAMYKKNGYTGVGSGPGQCGYARPDRPMPAQLQQALAKLDKGPAGIASGSYDLANYEQTEIVQQRIYEDPHRPLLKAAMATNQIVSGIPGLREPANWLLKARKPEVAISVHCGEGTPVPFAGSINSAQDRVHYYQSLVTEYLELDQRQRDRMGDVIRTRDPLNHGPDYGY